MSEILKKWIGVSQIDETLIRLNNNASMRGRNQANSADVNLLYIGTDNNLHLQTNVVFDTQFASQNILISGSTSGAITMKTGSTVTSYNISWPTAQATGAGQTISNDSAGNLTWVTFMNNPMTTLGDTTYGGSAGAVTRLAGDTSNTRKFLRELSVTGVATAPVWDTLVAGDIPSLTATYATVTLNNLGTTAVNAAIVPASNGAISLGASSLRWQNLYLNNAIFDSNGNAAISTANKTLTDNGNQISINWTSRVLNDTAGASQMTWGTTGVVITNALLPTNDNAIDVGSSSKRWANMRTVNDVWYGSTSGTITHTPAATTTSYALTWPSAQGTGALTNNGSGVLSWTSAGSGTVTSVSVTSANGFAGTVATATTTPAISISTTITGVIKGNGTAISAATAGTDYSAGTSALATGLLKSTTTTGALSIATSGTDYSAGTSALATGILKSTTTTGALTIAVAGDFPTLNQSTTGSAATVSGTNVVTNSNLSQMPTVTIKGNSTGGTANASDLTGAQVNTILPTFTSSLNGLAPSSGGGTTNFLRADGTWNVPTASAGSYNVTSQSTAYNASANDFIVASGSSFTITLPTAVGQSGTSIIVWHNGTSLANTYQINTTSSQHMNGVNGALSSGGFNLYTNAEMVKFTSNGTDWDITDHIARTGRNTSTTITPSATSAYVFTWTGNKAINQGDTYTDGAGNTFTVSTTTNTTTGTFSGTPGTPASTGILSIATGSGASPITWTSRTITGAPVKGTNSTDLVDWERDGSYAIVNFQYVATGAGTAGSGDYIFYLPTGLTLDTGLVSQYLGSVGTYLGLEPGATTALMQTTGSIIQNTSSYSLGLGAYSYSPTSFRIGDFFYDGGLASENCAGGGAGELSLSTLAWNFTIKVPILGWQP